MFTALIAFLYVALKIRSFRTLSPPVAILCVDTFMSI